MKPTAVRLLCSALQVQRLQGKTAGAEKETENIRRKRQEAAELKNELNDKLELQRCGDGVNVSPGRSGGTLVRLGSTCTDWSTHR